MTRISDLIRSTRDSLGMTQEVLAQATGYSVAGIRKIESGGSKSVRNGRQFVEVLGINPDDWSAAEAADRRDGLFAGATAVSRVAKTGGGMIPVVGRAAAAGDVGKLIMLDEVTEYAPRPSELDGVPDAYAVYVYGESMVPRFMPNERVYVHPYRPLAKDDFCVVQIGNPDPECAYIKQFISMDDKELRLKQYNPDKVISFKRSEVHSIGRVVAVDGV